MPFGSGRRQRPRRRRGPVPLLAGVAAGGLLLAACGTSEGSEVANLGDDAAAEDAAASTDAAATEEEILRYTECLRDQGVNVEDPQVDAEGNVGFGGVRVQRDDEGGFDAARERFEAAQEVCGDPPGGGFTDRSEAEIAEIQDAVLEMAQCMRDNGVDFPDPDVDGGRVMMGGPDADFDPDSPAFQAALEECRDIMSQFQGGPGVGPGAQAGG